MKNKETLSFVMSAISDTFKHDTDYTYTKVLRNVLKEHDPLLVPQ